MDYPPGTTVTRPFLTNLVVCSPFGGTRAWHDVWVPHQQLRFAEVMVMHQTREAASRALLAVGMALVIDGARLGTQGQRRGDVGPLSDWLSHSDGERDG